MLILRRPIAAILAPVFDTRLFGLYEGVPTGQLRQKVSAQSSRTARILPSHIHENVLSLANGWRIPSAYRLSDGTRIWVITEADRSSTTLLLPAEY